MLTTCPLASVVESRFPTGSYVSVVVACWALPKPADLSLMLFDALEADNYFGKQLAYVEVQSKGAFCPELSLLTSLLFAAVVLALAAYESLSSAYLRGSAA